MSVIVVGTEKNFAALRPRLFARSISSKTAGQVSAAIQAANPQADLKALVPGTVLFVPDDLPQVSVRGDLSLDPGAKGTAATVLATGDATLSDLVASARSLAGEAATARKKLTRTLAGDRITAAASKDKAIAASLTAARDALAAAAADDKSRAEALAQAQAEWSADLASLKATLPS